MLDIKFIRENPDLIREAARKKRIDFDVDALVTLDEKRATLLREIEAMRTEQNRVSAEISKTGSAGALASVRDEMRKLKEQLGKKEDEHKAVMQEWKLLMLAVPNVPDFSVPEGVSDADNQEVKKWGEPTVFPFTPKSHIDIMTALDMADFERGTKVAGFRGYFLKNDAVLLSFAIWKYAMDFFTGRGFSPMIVPSMVRRENLFGTGYLPQGEEDMYKTQDGEYLAGTAEVATMGYYSDEMVPAPDLPKKILSFSPCFRREAGSHGKDVKGLIRVHEFYKLEQVVLCEADHQTSVKFHEEINRNTEEFIESLGIPYRTVVNCGGDLGLGQVKKYDVELWVPLENTYREISSASYFHDFQARRLNIRYKDTEGKTRFVHSLNSTAIPTPRILVSIVENYQNEDGSLRVPAVLVPYLGKDLIAKK
jgi:seryl-tRNA synthetase